MQICSRGFLAALLLVPTVAAAATTTFGAEDVVRCPPLKDAHGEWSGSLDVGGRYKLKCHDGYNVDVSRKPMFSEVCPQDGEWGIQAKCVPIDGCGKLKHGCGPEGLCTDLEHGYRCDCIEGYELKQATDDSGEWVCGEAEKGVCDGHTCGAHGVCVDLSKRVASFDSGNIRTSTDTYRCSCADGYKDDGTKCQPLDCGELSDQLGTWVGNHTVGGEYTLKCDNGAFIFGSSLVEMTIQCPAHGSRAGNWSNPDEIPKCFSPVLEARDAAFATTLFWLNCGCALVCVVTAAIAAGLTTGMLSLDEFRMKVLMHIKVREVPKEERQRVKEKQHYAKRIWPVIADRHWLMVTLLLLNSLANEALPIFLDRLVPAYMAVLLSVTAVLIFGEVLPTAYFTGPDQVRIASGFVPLVKCLRYMFVCVALPIARLLDAILPKEDSDLHSRAELRAVLRLHCASEADTFTSESATSIPTKGAVSDVELNGDEEGDILDKTEFRVMDTVMAFRDVKLHTFKPDPISLHQVVYYEDLVDDVLDLVSKGELTTTWVLVSTLVGTSCKARQDGTHILQLTRASIVGLLFVGSLAAAARRQSKAERVKISTLTPDVSPQEIAWLESDQSILTALTLLSEKAQVGSKPYIGLVQAGNARAATVAGAGQAELQDRNAAVIGMVALEDLAANLAVGLQESLTQSPSSKSTRSTSSRSLDSPGGSSPRLAGTSPLLQR
mmetsp:Transcript_31380/g.57610  ORF Transcript_31380/g.57610 Transcript_31380/m.57610 type:complete len:721 (+) Transcript_31380:105-2267(+)